MSIQSTTVIVMKCSSCNVKLALVLLMLFLSAFSAKLMFFIGCNMFDYNFVSFRNKNIEFRLPLWLLCFVCFFLCVSAVSVFRRDLQSAELYYKDL